MAITRRIITAAGGKQVQANWNESDPNSPAYIQNKPDISGALTRQVVTELPTEDIDPNCIYMIAKSDPETGDYYDEYMYISDEWELIGSTQMTQVQSDWTQSDTTSPAYIDNKPATLDFIVPFTEVSDVVSTTVAKADIIAAINAGKDVRATLNDAYFELVAYSESPEKMSFSAVLDDTTVSIVGKVVNNNWVWETYDTELNVQADWAEADQNAPSYINNKPPIPQTETIDQSATPVLDIEDSVVIRCTVPLTSLTINRVAGGQYESNLYFTTGNSGFTMTVPNTLDGIVGSTVLEPNTDYIVCFKDNRMVISYSGYTGQVSVVNNAPTLAYGQSADIGSVNGTNLSVTMPPAPTFTQVNSDWNASSGVAQILNKPTIPTVNDATITIQQNGTTVGTFTTNDNTNQTINLAGTNDWFGTQEEFDALQSYDEDTNYHIEEELATVAFTGSYNDLDDKPTVPTQTSQLTNDGDGNGYAYATMNDLPSLTSDLMNDGEGGGTSYILNTDLQSGGTYDISDVVKGVDVTGAATALTLRIITQSDYDALVQGGTVDANTVYMIN